MAKTIGRSRKFTRNWPKADANEEIALERLGEILKLKGTPESIECFDISHVSGTFVVASMVRFQRGKPDKRAYRRFKIRAFEGNDDFRAMQEVVGRRYGRMHEEGIPFPDLVVIDGGIGQVRAAVKAFLLMELEVPPIIGLAKREETIVFPDERGELKLEFRDAALRLLQRARDEAHRFANQFNADLRSKRIRESVLDDFSGLGKVRRVALLEYFGSLEKMKKATPREIQQVEGFGPKLAERLHRFLQTGQSVS